MFTGHICNAAYICNSAYTYFEVHERIWVESVCLLVYCFTALLLYWFTGLLATCLHIVYWPHESQRARVCARGRGSESESESESKSKREKYTHTHTHTHTHLHPHTNLAHTSDLSLAFLMSSTSPFSSHCSSFVEVYLGRV